MILNLDNVSKTYIQGTTRIEVLKSIHMKLNKGERVALLGPSGSGKSTLLSLIAGLDTPDGGGIYLENQAMHTASEIELARIRASHIGIVFQQFHLIQHLTALENVMLPLELKHENHAHERALEALNEVGLKDRATHFPHQLSGGECQRVAIARAIVSRPKLLLADEPSGSLDTQTGNAVLDLLFRLMEEHHMTALIVTHSPELARRCQRAIHLQSGAIATPA